MKSDQELLDAVAHLCVTWHGMPVISTGVIARPTRRSGYYVIERQFAIGKVVMYLHENRRGRVIQDFVTWRVGP